MKKETKAPIQTKTKKEITRGKVVKLHKYWKGIASTMPTKEARRQYINMMLDATIAEIESKNKKRIEKDTGSDE